VLATSLDRKLTYRGPCPNVRTSRSESQSVAQAASEVDPGLKAAGTGIEDLLAFLAENEGPGGW
jgi:hypothetical protein